MRRALMFDCEDGQELPAAAGPEQFGRQAQAGEERARNRLGQQGSVQTTAREGRVVTARVRQEGF